MSQKTWFSVFVFSVLMIFILTSCNPQLNAPPGAIISITSTSTEIREGEVVTYIVNYGNMDSNYPQGEVTIIITYLSLELAKTAQ
jgi:hypothetical protein